MLNRPEFQTTGRREVWNDSMYRQCATPHGGLLIRGIQKSRRRIIRRLWEPGRSVRFVQMDAEAAMPLRPGGISTPFLRPSSIASAAACSVSLITRNVLSTACVALLVKE